MIININLELLNSLELTPNNYCFLYLLFHKQKAETSNEDKLYLQSKFYIKIIENGDCVLRQRGIDLFVVTDSLESFVAEYRSIFPEGVKTAGYLVRGTLQICMNKMKKFLKDYPQYSKSDILTATRYYVECKKADNYRFIQLAHYFIEKNRHSNLATYCEEIKSKEAVNGEDVFVTKI